MAVTPKLRVGSFALSVDGFGAGSGQTFEKPMGLRGEGLHKWCFKTRTFGGPEAGVDNGVLERSMENIGAWIMGRNMFSHSRDAWSDDGWKGWWGDNPPYHVPVIVLTHYPRDPIVMEGGTVFHFETGGIEVALEKARAFAGDKDVRLGGGTETVRQYLLAGLIDELLVAISPVLLGSGEAFWDGVDLPALGYEVVSTTPGEGATHVLIARTGDR